MGKKMQDGTLVLNVTHGKEIEVEYKKNEIVDKINSFFGYNCIKTISLKVIQNQIYKKNKILPKIKNLKKIQEKIDKVNNIQLKKFLGQFLKAYNERIK